MFKKLLGILVVAVSLVLAQGVFAYSAECGLKKMVESLHLDAAQKEKIKPILEQMKSQMKDNWSQMKDIRTQMHQQICSENMDQGTVDGLIDKKTKMMGDMMKAKVAAKHQIYMILNEKQRATFEGMAKKWQEKMAERFKKCHEED